MQSKRAEALSHIVRPKSYQNSDDVQLRLAFSRKILSSRETVKYTRGHIFAKIPVLYMKSAIFQTLVDLILDLTKYFKVTNHNLSIHCSL